MVLTPRYQRNIDTFVSQAAQRSNPMSNRTVRANPRTLPEATERPPLPALTATEIEALVTDFESAFQAQRPFFYGSGTDEEADAATASVHEIARKIVALPTTDIEMMRLKARIYLRSEATDLKSFAAKNEGDGSSEAVLASLFRDLGVADLDATPGPATMADRAPAQREEARWTEAPATEEPELQALIAAWQEAHRRLMETY
jgi:hypothetical protein